MSPTYGLNPLPFTLDETEMISIAASNYTVARGLEERQELMRDRMGLPPRMRLKASGIVGRWDENWCAGCGGWCALDAGHNGPCKQEED